MSLLCCARSGAGGASCLSPAGRALSQALMTGSYARAPGASGGLGAVGVVLWKQAESSLASVREQMAGTGGRYLGSWWPRFRRRVLVGFLRGQGRVRDDPPGA